jgi:hypothetical protein
VGEVSVSALPTAVVENTRYLLMETSSLRSTLSDRQADCSIRVADEPVPEIVECGEPIPSTICGRRIFRRIFLLPSFVPV